ncbi:MAG: 30S ribosomal protein S2, partial [Kiritimatiellae bacterium]|nr:30S ribosomal protein S2 [Kiritimatiellia bacterium]
MAEQSLSQLTLRDLMDAGLHFGHQTKRWNPKMKKYIYDRRGGIHIIDITQSLELLDQALAFAKKVAEDGGKILFVGTKKQAQEVVKTAAEECGSPYMTNRWLGGTLTNAQTIRKSVRRMRQLETLEKDNGGVLSPHKKEAAALRRELDKLRQNLSGIASMDRLPAAVYVVDVVREKNAVAEAKRLGIPVIAIVDTNADPDPVAWPVPGNDDSIRAIKLVSDSIAKIVKEGASAWERKAAEEARKAEAERANKRASAATDIAREKGDLPGGASDRPRRG